MLESFSDWKSITFIFYYLSFTILFGIIILPFYAAVASSLKEKERIIIMIFFFIYFFYCLFSIYNFIISLIYYLRGGINDYLIMVDFIIFKILEFHIFSFFGIFNSDNILDGSLLLNLERAIWIIIENLLDNFNANKKKLILTQIIVSSLTPVGIGIIVILIIVKKIIILIEEVITGIKSCFTSIKNSTKENNGNNLEKKKETELNTLENYPSEIKINNNI